MRYSLVTICYNAEKEIAATIESVLKQDAGLGFEYIIVDGASKDQTFAIARSYEHQFAAKGISFRCYSEPDKGISDAFNKGVLHAKGDIVGLVNAGDCLTDDALKALDSAFEEDVDIYYGNILWNDKERGMRYIRYSKPHPEELRLSMPILHPACFIRKSAYDSVGLYKIEFRYGMDRELLARMWKAGKRFKYINHTFSVMSAGGVSDASAYSAQRRKESESIAMACGVSRIRFEYTYNVAKCKFKLITLIKRYNRLFNLLRTMKMRYWQ